MESGVRVPTSSMGSVPQCRPWDRSDLMRRLATFKAMTWFGKPKAVSPVNCARRGWINVEMDVICCEACGARLLFSTPSSWTLQQVEKAAAVFSLKLDNGHKLLCPWINNACDEKLALFPPTPPPALVDNYKERSAKLLQLTSLPVISTSAIDYMKCPKLEHFLSQSSCPPVTLKHGISLTNNARSKDLAGAYEDTTANIYHQALKIISLCGWEPRLLPYVVDNEHQPSQSSGETLGEHRNSSIICMSEPREFEGRKNNWYVLGENQYDPASVVLDCSFCGACVGLWAFETVLRPLECFTLIADPNGQNESANRCTDLVNSLDASEAESSCKSNHSSASTSKERPVGLNLTIAGGPSPAKQKFRPIVSFPIVSRHLRAEFASTSGIKDCLSSQPSSGNHENSLVHSQFDVLPQHHEGVNGDLVVFSEDARSLKRKRNEDEIASESDYLNDPSHLRKELQGNGIEIKDKQSDSASGSKNQDTNEVHSLHDGTGDVVNSEEIIHTREEDSHRNDSYLEGAEGITLQKDKDIPNRVEAGESVCRTSDADAIIKDSEACENSGVDLGHNSNSQDALLSRCETSEHVHDVPLDITSCSAGDASQPTSNGTYTGRGDRNPDSENRQIIKANDQWTKRLDSLPPSSSGNEKADNAMGKTLMPSLLHHKINELDPIRQHRPFCPWIAPEEGESLPGWRLMLNALIQQDKQSSSEPPQQLDTSLTLMDEADDPVVSIRKLFMSPPSKRLKDSR